MLKVMKGDRPDRPPSGLSETLWNLLVATWVEQYAQRPRERPSASAVLTQLKRCVRDWGKSIIPLVPEDWENAGSCRMSPNDWQFVHVPIIDDDFTSDDDDLRTMLSDFHDWIGCLVVGEESEGFGLLSNRPPGSPTLTQTSDSS